MNSFFIYIEKGVIIVLFFLKIILLISAITVASGIFAHTPTNFITVTVGVWMLLQYKMQHKIVKKI